MNPTIASQKTVVKPLSHTMKETNDLPESLRNPFSSKRMEDASKPFDRELLTKKLLELQKEQERKEQSQEQFGQLLKDKLTKPVQSQQPVMLRAFLQPTFDEDDQSILDHHVSRVFSPGSVSPGQVHRPHQHRSSEMSSSLPDYGKETEIFLLKNFISFFV